MQASRPLPWLNGPKLEPFRFRDENQRKIRFLDHLGGGLHSEVFRASIDGSIYAVKLVCIRLPFGSRAVLTGPLVPFVHPTLLVQPNLLREGWVSVDDVINQNDPFHCECRAYG